MMTVDRVQLRTLVVCYRRYTQSLWLLERRQPVDEMLEEVIAVALTAMVAAVDD